VRICSLLNSSPNCFSLCIYPPRNLQVLNKNRALSNTLKNTYTFHFQNAWNYRMRWEGDYVVWILWISVLLILLSSIWSPSSFFSWSWLLEMDVDNLNVITKIRQIILFFLRFRKNTINSQSCIKASSALRNTPTFPTYWYNY